MAKFELKPCPFCGGEAYFDVNSLHKRGEEIGWDYHVLCRSCYAGNRKMHTTAVTLCENGDIIVVEDGREEAVAEWNGRA